MNCPRCGAETTQTCTCDLVARRLILQRSTWAALVKASQATLSTYHDVADAVLRKGLEP